VNTSIGSFKRHTHFRWDMAGALSHSMVPLHEIISSSEAQFELEPWGVAQDGIEDVHQFIPHIAVDDPALLDASLPRPVGVTASWPIGEVVRITRRSAFSGVSLAYRVVIGSVAFPGGGPILARRGRERADIMSLPPDLVPIEEDDEGFAEVSGPEMQKITAAEEEYKSQEKDVERGSSAREFSGLTEGLIEATEDFTEEEGDFE
jgi:DNA-directed RNA polymerase subunit H (RpoH/RPB5)